MKDLVLIDEKKLNPVDIFNGKKPDLMNKILEEIKNKTLTIVPDTTTEQGRKEIASLAHKVSKSKVLIDDMGKEYASDLKEKIKLIDGIRKTAREFLEELRDDIRKPLTDYEEEEKRKAAEAALREQERMDYIGSIINYILDAGRNLDGMSISEAENLINKMTSIKVDSSFDEFQERASITLDATIGNLKKYIEFKKAQEAEAKRLEQQRLAQEAKDEELRKKQEEIDRKERALKEKEEAAKREEERLAFEKKAREDAELEAREKIKREQEEQAKKEKEEKELEAKKLAEQKYQESLKPDIQKLNDFLENDVKALYLKANNLDLKQAGAAEIKQKIIKAIDQLKENIISAITKL